MTTEEFKKELEELGLRLCDHGFDDPYYTVENENGIIFARIGYMYECMAAVDKATFSDPEKQRKLFNTVTKYAATPIKERNPKRYFKYKLKSFSEDYRSSYDYLNYVVETNKFVLGAQKQTENCKTIFEENDPKLNKVDLEMFDPIGVDKEGEEVRD